MHVSLLYLLVYTALSLVLLLIFYQYNYRWVALLISSLLFYFFLSKLAFLILIIFSLLIFFSGKIIKKNKRNSIFYACIITSLLPLIIFKLLYSSGFIINIPAFSIHNKKIYAIIGLSFFTFNGISYLLDIRKGYTKPEKNYGLILLYLSFFPHILAGPLHRARNLLEQFKTRIHISNSNFSSGFRLIIWGVFKNYVLAQPIKMIVDSIINYPETFSGAYVLFAGFLFFIQIYCDFSSYVDICHGIAQFFGITFKKNFNNRVYAASSRMKFWEGWHITLNHWFRDYFFFPLTKNAKSKVQINLAIVLTFILIGLWHGITWGFFLWGVINAAWALLERYFKKYFSFISNKWIFFGVIYHVAIASVVAIIFRTGSLTTIKSLFSKTANNSTESQSFLKQFIIIVPFFLFMDYVYRKAKDKRIDIYLGEQKIYTRWGIYILLIICIFTFGIVASDNHYYFKF